MKSFEVSWNHFGFSKIVLDFMESIMKSYNTKDETYVCIHAPYTHTCTTKYHQNVRYTQLAFPLYSMKHQVIMRDLCWISCFCCFSVKSAVLFSKKCSFMKSTRLFMKSAMLISEKCSAFEWKAQLHEKHSTFQWKAPLFSKILWGFGLSPSIGLSYIYIRKTNQSTFHVNRCTCPTLFATNLTGKPHMTLKMISYRVYFACYYSLQSSNMYRQQTVYFQIKFNGKQSRRRMKNLMRKSLFLLLWMLCLDYFRKIFL